MRYSKVFPYQERIENDNEVINPTNEELANKIKDVQKSPYRFPWVLMLLLLIPFFGFDTTSVMIIVIIVIVLICILGMIESTGKKITILYDNIGVERNNVLLALFEQLSASKELHFLLEDNINSVQVVKGRLYRVYSDIEMPCLKSGNISLCFFPDVLVIVTKNEILSFEYTLFTQLSVSEVVRTLYYSPSDAEIVGQTWEYVNKNGTPDKRRKDNPKIYEVKYAKIDFDGVDLLISNVEIAHSFAESLSKLFQYIINSQTNVVITDSK